MQRTKEHDAAEPTSDPSLPTAASTATTHSDRTPSTVAGPGPALYSSNQFQGFLTTSSKTKARRTVSHPVGTGDKDAKFRSRRITDPTKTTDGGFGDGRNPDEHRGVTFSNRPEKRVNLYLESSFSLVGMDPDGQLVVTQRTLKALQDDPERQVWELMMQICGTIGKDGYEYMVKTLPQIKQSIVDGVPLDEKNEKVKPLLQELIAKLSALQLATDTQRLPAILQRMDDYLQDTSTTFIQLLELSVHEESIPGLATRNFGTLYPHLKLGEDDNGLPAGEVSYNLNADYSFEVRAWGNVNVDCYPTISIHWLRLSNLLLQQGQQLLTLDEFEKGGHIAQQVALAIAETNNKDDRFAILKTACLDPDSLLRAALDTEKTDSQALLDDPKTLLDDVLALLHAIDLEAQGKITFKSAVRKAKPAETGTALDAKEKDQSDSLPSSDSFSSRSRVGASSPSRRYAAIGATASAASSSSSSDPSSRFPSASHPAASAPSGAAADDEEGSEEGSDSAVVHHF